MKKQSLKRRTCVGFVTQAFLLIPLSHLQASVVYLTTSTGDIYQYDSVADMAAQTSSTPSGTLVSTVAAYGTDQGATMDHSSGMIYRVTASGDIVSYNGIDSYLANNGTTVAALVYSGNNSLNGFSYDGGTAGFYAIGGGTAGNNAQGDLIQWGSLGDFLANTNRTVTASTYNGNIFNFYDPEGTVGTTFGAPPTYPATSRTTQYYQSSGAGRLEGWESLSQYASATATQGDKRVHYTPENVYGGNSAAFGSTAIDAVTAFAVPESGTAVLALLGTLAISTRRRAKRP